MDQIENQKYSEEVEVDLKEVFAYIVRKFKTVLLWGIVFMLAFGGSKAYKEISKQNDDTIEDEQTVYEEDLALYNAQKVAYEEQIDSIYDQLNSEKEYQEHSVLMSIDPYNEYRDTITYYVYTDYQIMPGMDYQNVDPALSIIAAYAAAAENVDMNSEIIKSLDVEITARDLQELIIVDCDRNTDVDSATRILTITTIGNTQELADQLMDYVKEQINNQKDTITAEIGEHELRMINETSAITMDQDLQYKLTGYNNTIVTLEENLAEVQESLNNLEEPEAPSSVLVSTVKYALIGFIIGVLLSALFIGIVFVNKYLCSGEDELTEQYGIPVLGHIFGHEQQNVFEKWSDRIRGIQRNAVTEDQQYSLITEYLSHLKKQPGSIAVVSDMDSEKARMIVEQLKEYAGTINLVYCGNSAIDANAMHSMNEQNTVLLLIDWNHSTKRNVINILKNCTNCDKTVCGAVVLV